MDNKDLLDDDIDWDAELENFSDEADTNTEPAPVTMLQTFNTEQEAYLAAAILRAEGIDGRVVSAITGQMTPFAYGNVRLFVAQSQAGEAAKILRSIKGKEAVYKNPVTSSTQILIVITIGLFVMGLILALLRSGFNVF